MIYELRRYALVPGGAPAMHHRMEDELLPMFGRHGFQGFVGAWDVVSGPGTPAYIWMLEWSDYQSRADAWRSFHAEWGRLKARDQSPEFSRGGYVTLIEPWGNATYDFSTSSTAVDELWLLNLRMQSGLSAKAATFAAETAALSAAGASLFGGFDVVFGSVPQCALFVSWPDAGARRQGLPIYEADAALEKGRKSPDGEYSSIIECVDRYLLERAPYCSTPGRDVAAARAIEAPA